MLMIVLNKKRFKLIVTIILLIIFVFGGGFFILKNNSNAVIRLIGTEDLLFERGDKKNSGYVALTCNIDLGWKTEYVDNILSTLDKEGVKITFNVTGKWAEKNKDELLKIKKAGHEIGNHGNEHLDYSKLSYDENVKQISTAKKTIEEIIGQKTNFFQAPAGSFGSNTVKAARKLGYISFKWDADTIDWMYKDQPDMIVKNIKKRDIKDGSIVLIHPTLATTKSLPEIIHIIEEKSLKVGRLCDVFN